MMKYLLLLLIFCILPAAFAQDKVDDLYALRNLYDEQANLFNMMTIVDRPDYHYESCDDLQIKLSGGCDAYNYNIEIKTPEDKVLFRSIIDREVARTNTLIKKHLENLK